MANPYRKPSIEARAIAYAVAVIDRGATDWQEVQDALSNRAEIAEWLDGDLAVCQRIIRKAEAKFNGKLPATYSD